MEDHCLPSLVGAMDRLWFHNITLLSEPMIIFGPKTIKPISETPLISLSSPNLSASAPSEEEIAPTIKPVSETPLISLSSPNLSASAPSEDEIAPASCPTTAQDNLCKTEEESRPTRLNLETQKTRSLSSSPLVKKISNRLIYEERRLRKTKSMKNLWELEYEELKGFSDLGFKFKKELVTPRMMTVIPGLQRLEEYEHRREKHRYADDEAPENDEIEVDGEEGREVRRPYLSEAWLIKRPDSPLLNLRIPQASATDDMKTHLRFWARAVAAVIQQES